jgi:hypothetical protein
MFALKLTNQTMKKTTLMVICVLVVSATSCKKDRNCECTVTYTNQKGVTEASPATTVTYTKIKKSEAQSICQKTTIKSVDENQNTNTTVNDCKLK